MTPAELFILRLFAFFGIVTVVGFWVVAMMFFYLVFDVIRKRNNKK